MDGLGQEMMAHCLLGDLINSCMVMGSTCLFVGQGGGNRLSCRNLTLAWCGLNRTGTAYVVQLFGAGATKPG